MTRMPCTLDPLASGQGTPIRPGPVLASFGTAADWCNSGEDRTNKRGSVADSRVFR